MKTTDTFIATLPLDFFDPLLAFNAELLNGNAMLLRACGAQPRDGSILRSKEYLLFGHGMATLAMWPQHPFAFKSQEHYVVTVTERMDSRKVRYWEIQAAKDQTMSTDWTLCVASEEPDPKNEGEIKILVQSDGHVRQFFYLRRYDVL
ncbi:MAG: hypothetical protein HY420_04275 [Candidatus Kerfeldbacteria bacterium]|nr:hypothetical protein [Candidatus Kerfeldbacteria bacterium]